MGRTTVQASWVTYIAEHNNSPFPRRIPRDSVPVIQRMRGWKVDRRLGARRVKACVWCRARPSIWDTDCDGAYDTHRCNSPQCQQAYSAYMHGEGPKPNYY